MNSFTSTLIWIAIVFNAYISYKGDKNTFKLIEGNLELIKNVTMLIDKGTDVDSLLIDRIKRLEEWR